MAFLSWHLLLLGVGEGIATEPKQGKPAIGHIW